MDAWDDDFEDDGGELSVPQSLKVASQTVSDEGVAAKELADVVRQLRQFLIDHPCEPDSPAAASAVGLVHASLENTNDEFYNSQTWKSFQHVNLHLQADSFVDVLEQARRVLFDLTAGL